MGLLDGVLNDVGGLLVGPGDGPDLKIIDQTTSVLRTPTSPPVNAEQVTSGPRSATASSPRPKSVAKLGSVDESDESDNENTLSISSRFMSKGDLDSVSLPSSSADSSSLSATATSRPVITSGSSTYPAARTSDTSDRVIVSTLIVAGPAISATLAEGNRAVKDENIFHTHNKLFPLAVIAVVVAALFFLMTAAFFLIRIFGWNRKRRNRKLTPSFYVDRNTMFEPKFDMLGTSGNIVGATGPYNPIASTVDLHRNGSHSTIGSGQAMYNVAAPGPASTRPPDRSDEGNAYDGAFFPSSQQDNPFVKPGEYYTYTQPKVGRPLLPSSSPPGSQQTPESNSVDDVGSPVPSFNTGRIYAQVDQPHITPAPIGIPTRGLHIPPPYQTPSDRSERVNLQDEYKFNMLTREPSNRSNLMSRTRAMKTGVRNIGTSSSSGWQEGRRGDGRAEDEESIIESYVSNKSSKLSKKPTWGSDRV